MALRHANVRERPPSTFDMGGVSLSENGAIHPTNLTLYSALPGLIGFVRFGRAVPHA